MRNWRWVFSPAAEKSALTRSFPVEMTSRPSLYIDKINLPLRKWHSAMEFYKIKPLKSKTKKGGHLTD